MTKSTLMRSPVWVEFAVSAGVAGICLPAYGSEFYKLTSSEVQRLVNAAVKEAAGRVQEIAQSNHPSSRWAAALARQHEDLGADVIAFAIPRQFALSDSDVLRYCQAASGAVSVPVLIQDFNPGGSSVSAALVARIAQAAGNFRYLKLEEPLMSVKVRAIRAGAVSPLALLSARTTCAKRGGTAKRYL